MKAILTAFILVCTWSPAFAGQVDYILRFADQPTARTALATYARSSTDANGQTILDWARERVIPDLQVWRASQDTTQSVTGPDGNPVNVTVHAYLAGYYLLVSLEQVVPALVNAAAVQVVIDRDKAIARQAGAVIKSNVSNAVLQDIRFSPTFAGMDVPWGAMQ